MRRMKFSAHGWGTVLITKAVLLRLMQKVAKKVGSSDAI